MRQITLKKPVASVSSLGGSARVVFAATFACFMSAASLSAQGSTNVFNDAVFWFRGGKDKNSDGYIDYGEFFDDLRANNPNDGNHNMTMSSTLYTGQYGSLFKGNAVFRNEQVVFPALGASAAKDDVQVLHISDDVQGGSYYFPFSIKPRYVLARNEVSNEYTIVSRIRLDDDTYNREFCLMKLGYDDTEKQGMWLGFEKQSSSPYKYCRRIVGHCTPDSDSVDTGFSLDLYVPTNTWVDLAVVVGNGKLRVGIALPQSLALHSNNPTVAFDQTAMWTDNCAELTDLNCRFFCKEGRETWQKANATDLTAFIGSVQQMAIWKRALDDQEVMEAFGMPRPAIFRTGLDNGNSNEFGGTRTGSSQEIDGLGSWQNIANTMKAGDTWTVNFSALRDEAGLPQIFSIKSLNGSAAQIEPVLNGTSLGEGRIAANSRAFWPVTAGIVREGANELVIRRKDGGTRDFLVDAIELGGSLGVGKITTSSTDDGRINPLYIKTGVPSAADPNTQHWPQGLMPSTGVTNLHFRVWVDPELADKASFTFKTGTRYNGSSASDFFSIFVNDEYITKLSAQSGWKEQTLLPAYLSNLHGGWNDLEFVCTDDLSCYWDFAYFRFEAVLPSPFGFSPAPGLTVVVR